MPTSLMPERRHTDRIAHWIIASALAVIGLAVLFVGLTMVRPYWFITRNHMTVSVVGAVMHVQMDYCKTENRTPTAVRWALVDGITILIPRSPMTLPTGCHIVTIMVDLPEHVIPGTYVLQHEVFYCPWPWRTVSFIHVSPPFVIPPRPPARPMDHSMLMSHPGVK